MTGYGYRSSFCKKLGATEGFCFGLAFAFKSRSNRSKAAIEED